MRLLSLFFVLLAVFLAVRSAEAEAIEASVGKDGVNSAPDVLAVQILLNQVPSADGGPERLLVPDGLNGPQTVAAIERFQRQQLGDDSVMGRLEPGKQAVERLIAIVDQQPRNDRIVRVAEGERLFWQDGKRTELDERVTRRLLVKRRASNTATYENIEKGHPTHGDIVVAIANGKAETIGGNVSNSVRTTLVNLDDQRKVKDERYFAIVKVK